MSWSEHFCGTILAHDDKVRSVLRRYRLALSKSYLLWLQYSYTQHLLNFHWLIWNSDFVSRVRVCSLLMHAHVQLLKRWSFFTMLLPRFGWTNSLIFATVLLPSQISGAESITQCFNKGRVPLRLGFGLKYIALARAWQNRSSNVIVKFEGSMSYQVWFADIAREGKFPGLLSLLLLLRDPR